ncbi:hypothetical protein [Sphingomonas sp. KR3-1]|uniref:hypothetical protein n=1 Tax=Sphingomonas sp. KR3-1 TaxID=3156611 RepID=UPI0032B44AB5
MNIVIGAILLVSGAQDAPQTAPQPTPVVATAAPAAPIVARPTAVNITGSTATLPANTEVVVSMNAELNSKKFKKEGHKFDLSVASDVRMGDYVIIPKGTPAYGIVTYRTGKGAFGKSAKMEFDITHIDLNGNRIPLKGHFRQEGQGNTGAAVGAVVAVGVFGAFVTGKSAIVEQGREFRVYTTEPLNAQVGGSATSSR